MLINNDNLKFKMLYNNKLKSFTCQQKKSNSIKNINRQSPIEWNIVDPTPNLDFALGIILAFRPATLKVLNALLLLGRRYKHIYAAQEGAISRLSKCHWVTVNKEIKLLHELGFIEKLYISANKSCWYKISTWFNNPNIQQQLKSKLPIFYFTIFTLFSCTTESWNSKSAKRSINVFNFINKTTTSIYEESDIYNKENVERKSSKKKEIKKEMRILDKLQKELNLGEYETTALAKFSEELLFKAYKAYKQTPGIDYPFRFIVSVCNKISEKEKVQSQTQSVVKPIQNKKVIITEQPTFDDIQKCKKKIQSYERCIKYAEQTYEKYPTDVNFRWIQSYKKMLETEQQKLNQMQNWSDDGT